MTKRKIIQVENIELSDYTLLQLTLYNDGNISVGVWKDKPNEEEQAIAEIDVPKNLIFSAVLRLFYAHSEYDEAFNK